MGYLFASAWELGVKTNNVDFKGFAARGMTYVDQTALDGGKTALSWLRPACPSPKLLIGAKKQAKESTSSLLTPGSGPLGCSEHQLYLRDLEFMETKIKVSGTTTYRAPHTRSALQRKAIRRPTSRPAAHRRTRRTPTRAPTNASSTA